jgi:hypothetical protein
MTWGGGFTHGDLIKVAEEKDMSMCGCVMYIRRRKKLDDTYHGPNYGVLPNEPELGTCKNNCTLERARKSITYPQKLAKLLGSKELFDLSKPGESCQYVVRTTIDFFLERDDRLLDEDLSDYIVFLQMPNGLRFEYWKEDSWNNYMINNSDSKTIIDLFGNDMYDSYNIINSIMQVGSFLKENNIRYYISSLGKGFTNVGAGEKLFYGRRGGKGLRQGKRRIEYIETNYNILGGSLNNSRLVGEVPFKEVRIPGDGHYSEHGHTVVANNIYRLIND